MKTPFDTAMRVQRREIDEMGAAINAQVRRLNEIERAQEYNRCKIADEAAVAGEGLAMPSYAYMERIRAERSRLAHDSSIQGARLETLRVAATEAYGAFRAVEVAAEAYREEADRRSANAEQARIDDLSAAAFLNARRLSQKDDFQ